jgi:hypothetical protein
MASSGVARPIGLTKCGSKPASFDFRRSSSPPSPETAAIRVVPRTGSWHRPPLRLDRQRVGRRPQGVAQPQQEHLPFLGPFARQARPAARVGAIDAWHWLKAALRAIGFAQRR